MMGLLIAGSLMVEKLEEGKYKEKVILATKVEQQKLLQETEVFAFEIADEIFKSDEEIGEEGIEVKNKLIESLIKTNYKHLGVESPFDNGATFKEIELRSKPNIGNGLLN